MLTSYKYADVSTSHITVGDDEILTGLALRSIQGRYDSLIVYPTSHGYFVFISSDLEEDKLRGLGLSDDFISVVRLAQSEGNQFVRFDADAETYEGLASHAW